MTMQTAIARGMKRGMRLGMNPTISNYRRIRTHRARTVDGAWRRTGTFIRRAMEQESRNRRI